MAEFDLTDGTNSRIESSLTGAEGKFSAPVSRLEQIIKGEDIKPLSRIEEVMKNYSPQPGPGGSSIVVIEGTKNSEGTTVTLDKSFSEIKALIEERNIPIIMVTGLPYAGKNYYVLYNKYDGTTVNESVNFIFSGTDCKYNSETNVLEIKNIHLGLDETENNVARVINNNADVTFGTGGLNAVELTEAQYDELTTEQKNNGTLYLVAGASEIAVPIENISIGKYIENMYVCQDEVSQDGKGIISEWYGGSQIGNNFWLLDKVDVTDYTELQYDLDLGTCYGTSSAGWYYTVGLMSSVPSNFYYSNDSSYAVKNSYTNQETSYTGESLDVTNLTGEYYIIVVAHGWNATLSNIRLFSENTQPNRIYFMDTEFANNASSYKELSGTLTAGETSLTLTHSSITINSLYDIYTTVYGVNPTDVTVTAGSITLTFDAQQSDLGVKVRVS